MKLHCVTFTGVDEYTDLPTLKQLNTPDQPVEWGFLYSAKRQGQEPRYPSREWLLETIAGLGQDLSMTRSLALHVCGTDAIEQLWRGELADLTEWVDRVQINGPLPRELVEDICERHPKKTIITQHTGINLGLLRVPQHNHVVLVDGSGGRGQVPQQWRRPQTTKLVGFAGGLGPNNIDREIELIKRAAEGRHFWIDMEGKIRRPAPPSVNPTTSPLHDYFNLDCVDAVLTRLAEIK